MTESITLTRQGYIKHLATVQKLLQLVGVLHGNVSRSFPEAECEADRNEKIGKAFVKLQELIWETGAVSERIHREKGRGDPAFDAHDRDPFNRKTEEMRDQFHKAARELERLAHGLWDEDAPEVVTAEAIYPGAIQEPDDKEDPNQLRLGLRPADVLAVAGAAQDKRESAAQGKGAAQDRRSGAAAAQDRGRSAAAAQDRRVIDYKKAAAHDDTTAIDGEDEVSGDWDDGL